MTRDVTIVATTIIVGVLLIATVFVVRSLT